MKYCYKFPVVKGKQAGKDYYIGMVPLNMLSKIFQDDDEYVLPEFRAQRKLNELRIPEIKNYILENQNTYVFSALTASIDGEFEFHPMNNEDVGILEISLNAKFLINDGQHRKAAILAAIDEKPELGEESISVVFFEDRGLARSQQMFTDLNKHAVKTSNSLSELYDSRDPIAVATREAISEVDFLNKYTDKEKDNLGKFSSNLFTLNVIYRANKRILKNKSNIQDSDVDFLKKFWNSVAENIEPWVELEEKQLSKKELRENYIVTQGVVIQALGIIGEYFYTNSNVDLMTTLKKLKEINWKRNSKEWKLRTIRLDGRIISNDKAIILTSNIIKKLIGIELSDDEQYKENEYNKSVI